MKRVRALSNLAASPVLLHYLLPVLMAYLIIGTVAQKYIGLYQATQVFFSAPVIWFEFIPLPGVPVILGLIFINLLAKLIYKSPWSVSNAGNILTHTGVMLLLIGGLLSALTSREGYIDLAVGQQGQAISDYHIRELVLHDAEGYVIWRIDHADILPQQSINIPVLNEDIYILQTCRHCRIEKRERTNDGNYVGMAQHMQLKTAPLRLDDEENLTGLTFRVQDKTFTILENIPRPALLTAGNKSYSLSIERQVRTLPFTVELLDFQRDYYPGTTMPQAYSSRVRIIDGTQSWESTISMNQPLRYQGYTLYQSSFIATEQGDISVLSVVHNTGRIFPYASTIIICCGLLLHLMMRRRKHV